MTDLSFGCVYLCQQVQSKKKTIKDAGAQQWISPFLSCKGSWEIQFSNPLNSLTQPTSDRKAPATPAVTRVRMVDPHTMLPWTQSFPTPHRPRRTCHRSRTVTHQVWACTSHRPNSPCTHSSPTAQLMATGQFEAMESTVSCQGKGLSWEVRASRRDPCPLYPPLCPHTTHTSTTIMHTTTTQTSLIYKPIHIRSAPHHHHHHCLPSTTYPTRLISWPTPSPILPRYTYLPPVLLPPLWTVPPLLNPYIFHPTPLAGC